MKKTNGVLTEVSRNDIELLKVNPDYFWSEVNEIGSFAFTNSGVEQITIPESVKNLKERAFAGCKNLKAIALPQSMNKVSKFASIDYPFWLIIYIILLLFLL